MTSKAVVTSPGHSEATSPPKMPSPGRAKSRRPGAGLAYIILSLVAAFNIAIFLWLLLQSLKPANEFLSTLPWEFPTHWAWSNFSFAWENADIGGYVLNSVIVCIGATVLSLVVSTPAAYALSRLPRSNATGIIRNLFFVGLLMPPVVLIVPLYFELSAVGMLNNLVGLVIVYAGLSLPFSIWYLSSFFEALPRELEEAAAIDGADATRIFLKVFLPNAAPGCFAVFVVNFLWAWNEFFFALTFLNSDSKFTIALGVFNLQVNATYSAQWTIMFAGMLISIIPVLALYALMSEQITKAMAQGAVKG